MKAEDIRVLLLNPAPSLIKYGMKWGFEQCGCYVYLMEGEDQVYLENDPARQLQKIEKCMIEHKINFLFCEGYAKMPIPDISQLCRKHNIKFHFWAIEDPVTPHIAENVASNKFAEFVWTTTEEFIPKYEKFGVGSDLLLFGCNPEFSKPVPSQDEFKHDISLVGTNYSNRFDKTKEFIFPLIDRGLDIKIYGLWWLNETAEVNLIKYKEKGIDVYWEKEGYQQLPFEWLPIVINSSKIMLGVNCSDYSKTQTSCRPFETLSAAKDSVYLAYYTKAQEAIFGDFIVQAKSGREMVRKAEDILTWSKEKREKFASKARTYVLEKHNYKVRAKQILKVLGV